MNGTFEEEVAWMFDVGVLLVVEFIEVALGVEDVVVVVVVEFEFE